MVKIINGEIVPDNDPRVRSMGGAGGGPGRRWGGNVRGVHSPAPVPLSSSTRGQSSSTGPSDRGTAPATPPLAGPVDQIAVALGVNGKSITVPAIDPLGFSATNIPLIYVVALGLGVVFFGVNMLLFAIVGYAYYKYTERQHQ